INGNSAAYLNPGYAAAAGSISYNGTVTNGIYSYATWTTLGFGNLGTANAWTANTMVPFFRVPFSNSTGACVDFEVLNDAFQVQDNTTWYISLGGEDRTDGFIAGMNSTADD